MWLWTNAIARRQPPRQFRRANVYLGKGHSEIHESLATEAPVRHHFSVSETTGSDRP